METMSLSEVKTDVLDAIGNTPLIRLKGPSERTGCEILGKAEFMNPGQSVKDRAAKLMISILPVRRAVVPLLSRPISITPKQGYWALGSPQVVTTTHLLKKRWLGRFMPMVTKWMLRWVLRDSLSTLP